MSLEGLIAGIAAEHANERGAALAYRGHAASLGDAPEAAEIRAIEAEEWHHRAALAEMLAGLGGGLSWWREPVMAAAGWCIGVACHVGGWLVPMWGAGLIERSNIAAYRRLVDLALAAGRPDLAATLAWLGMWRRTRWVGGCRGGRRRCRSGTCGRSRRCCRRPGEGGGVKRGSGRR
jgi:hypothetical protein